MSTIDRVHIQKPYSPPPKQEKKESGVHTQQTLSCARFLVNTVGFSRELGGEALQSKMIAVQTPCLVVNGILAIRDSKKNIRKARQLNDKQGQLIHATKLYQGGSRLVESVNFTAITTLNLSTKQNANISLKHLVGSLKTTNCFLAIARNVLGLLANVSSLYSTTSASNRFHQSLQVDPQKAYLFLKGEWSLTEEENEEIEHGKSPLSKKQLVEKKRTIFKRTFGEKAFNAMEKIEKGEIEREELLKEVTRSLNQTLSKQIFSTCITVIVLTLLVLGSVLSGGVAPTLFIVGWFLLSLSSFIVELQSLIELYKKSDATTQDKKMLAIAFGLMLATLVLTNLPFVGPPCYYFSIALGIPLSGLYTYAIHQWSSPSSKELPVSPRPIEEVQTPSSSSLHSPEKE